MLSKKTMSELQNLGYIVKVNEEITGFSGVKHKIPILIINPDNDSKVALHFDDGSGEVQLLRLFSFFIDTGIEQVLLSGKKTKLDGVRVVKIKKRSDIIKLIVDWLGETNKLKARTYILTL